MADYDSGEITDRERLAADRQREIARYNAKSVANQLDQQLNTYNMANKQNRRLADIQLKQNSRKAEDDRFEAQRNLQNATIGLLGSMNQAMNGSSIGNLMRMLENRSDADNVTYWSQLQQNQNAVNNAYDEAFNQNQIGMRDAGVNATKALRDISGDLSANLSNINPNLYEKPEIDSGVRDILNSVVDKRKSIKGHNAALSGYLMPDTSVQTARDISGRNRLNNNDYFGRMINQFNRRY